jgi:cytoskeletal protein CcmA (bactofilin family)
MVARGIGGSNFQIGAAQMEKFSGHHEGDFTLTGDLEISGLVSGTVTVPAGHYLLLGGMITGDLIVKNSGRATVHGTVVGTVLNEGAIVEVFGMVGRVMDVGPDATRIDAAAMVRNSN